MHRPVPRDTFLAWARLLRLPNLFTVPGDPIAGFLLAASPHPETVRLASAVGASLLLYTAGLIGNDLADINEDRRERPDRPLPSGRISQRQAGIAAVAAASGGLALAALGDLLSVAAPLAGCIALYTFLPGGRRIGPLLLGLCRGLSLLLGAAAAGAPLATSTLTAAATLAGYIAAVSIIAAGETRVRRIAPLNLLPALVLALGFAAMTMPAPRLALSILPAVALALFHGAALRATPAPQLVRRAVGGWLGMLPLIQAYFIFLAIPVNVTLLAGVLSCWPLTVLLGRRFYAT